MVQGSDMGNLDHLADLLGLQLAAPLHRKLGRTETAGRTSLTQKSCLGTSCNTLLVLITQHLALGGRFLRKAGQT